MNKAKNKNFFIRVSEKEKNIIEQNAKKSGLSVSEYLHQRALRYMPRAVLPEIFFTFNDKLDEPASLSKPKLQRIRKKTTALIDGITSELILPQKKAA